MGDDKKYQNLRNKKDTLKERWNLSNLRDGFSYFFDLNRRYPTTKEVDLFDYLPTRKTIERSFGGIVELRKILNLDTPSDHRTGATRSKMAASADQRARKYEVEFYNYLTSHIPEVRVHEHKIIRPGDTAADFFIYTTDNTGIVVDLFYAMDTHSLGGIVNIKLKKYLNVRSPVYFVLVGNEKLTQEVIDKKMDGKDNSLPEHIKVMSEKTFKNSFSYLVK